jgi:N-acetylglutamate synthase-like GNAT family acetyltransferase
VVIGCGQLKPHGKNICELASIAVQPAWRGQGVARAIIENLLKENETGSCEVYLTCRAALEPFYMKFGFDIARGKLPGYFSWVHNLTRILRLLGLTRQAILVMHYRSGGST